MIPSIIERVTTSLLHSQNQFASGGLLLMVIGGIAAYARNLPTRLWDWIERQFTLRLTITDESDGFYWFKWWFKNQEYCKRNRNMDAFTPGRASGPRYVLAPAPGRHWFFYKKRPIFVHFERTEEKKGSENAYARRSEKYLIWTFGRISPH
jgi:chaperone BCS1